MKFYPYEIYIGYESFYNNSLTEVSLPASHEDYPPTYAFDSGNFIYREEVVPEPTPEPEPEPTPEPEPEPEPTPEPEPKDYKLPKTKKTINGTNKDDNLKGTNKNDLITGKKGDDKLNGSSGSDVLKGQDGKDILKGAKGKDYLHGANGKDVLIGGKGADVFQISKGTDCVEDFRIKQGDRIGLGAKGKYKIIDDKDGVLIKANSKNKLLLEGVAYDDVIAAGVDLFVQPV